MTAAQTLAAARTVFLETSVLIYFIESHPTFASLVAPVFEGMDGGTKVGISSQITLFEVLTKPFELGRADLVDRYKALLLGHPNLRIFDVGAQIAEEAARLRAQFRLKKAPDAIQLATAKLERVDAFLTNDIDLKRVTTVPVVVLGELVATSS